MVQIFVHLNKEGDRLVSSRMGSMDKYKNYEDLRRFETEGQDYTIEIRKVVTSPVVIFAPHGGGIEPGTSELAIGIAGKDYSFGNFNGMKRKNNSDLHITSTNFDEPRITDLVKQSEVVIALHGEGSEKEIVYLGGLDNELKVRIEYSLKRNGFTAATHDNPSLQGASPHNICNRGLLNKGVQLEITKGLRRRLFESLTSKGRERTTNEFKSFVSAIREALTDS